MKPMGLRVSIGYSVTFSYIYRTGSSFAKKSSEWVQEAAPRWGTANRLRPRYHKSHLGDYRHTNNKQNKKPGRRAVIYREGNNTRLHISINNTLGVFVRYKHAELPLPLHRYCTQLVLQFPLQSGIELHTAKTPDSNIIQSSTRVTHLVLRRWPL